MTVVEIAPVVKTLDVARSAADAFRIFTADMGAWWPLDTHALSPENGTRAVGVTVEPRVSGRVYERGADGREFDWGEVLAYDPGAHFAMTWRLGRPAHQATEVSVRFEALGPEACRVTLTHSHWERLGEAAPGLRDGYDSGWGEVFGRRFAAAVA